MSETESTFQPAPAEKPQTQDKLYWCSYAVAAVLAIMGLVSLNDFRCALVAQKRWVPASGWVKETEVVRHHSRHSTSYATLISYTYAADNAIRRAGPVELNKYKFHFSESGAQADLDKDYPQGKSIRVYYNPSAPDESSLGLAGAPGLSIPIAFFALAFGIIYFARQ